MFIFRKTQTPFNNRVNSRNALELSIFNPSRKPETPFNSNQFHTLEYLSYRSSTDVFN